MDFITKVVNTINQSFTIVKDMFKDKHEVFSMSDLTYPTINGDHEWVIINMTDLDTM